MWDGGNVAHYAPSYPRVLIDGKLERAPWIDLADLKARGALVVGTDSDRLMPVACQAIAADAAISRRFGKIGAAIYIGRLRILRPRSRGRISASRMADFASPLPGVLRKE